MTQGNQQQQGGQQQGGQQQGGQQQQQGGQQQSPAQRLAQSLSRIRKVQNLLEMNFPGQGEAIKLQREAGDLVWAEIQRMQQQQGQQ